MQFVPIQSYHKATLAALYDNEGEASWDIEKLAKEISSNPKLMEELKKTGYKERSKSFTGQQIAIIFNYISRPILNQKNRKLLKMENELNLLDHFNANKNLLNDKMANIDEIPPAALSQMGLRYIQGPDCNDHYTFIYNPEIYLLKKPGCFEIHCRNTFKIIEKITETPALVLALLKYKK